MKVTVNKHALAHARELIKNRLEVEHAPSGWHAVKPTHDEEVRFLDTHSLDEYGSWFLGVDHDADPKSHTKFHYPFGDLKVVHVSALHESKKAAQQHGHHDIVKAIDELLALIDQYK